MTQGRARRAAALAVLIASSPLGGSWGAERPLALQLADLGPRPPESLAHDRAVELLLAALRSAGLQQVEARTVEIDRQLADQHVLLKVPPVSERVGGEGRKALQLFNLTGVLPGSGPGEIALSAHYDSVPESPGAGDDASGCGTVIAAVEDLGRTPLQHTVRVILFDGEEAGLLGSKAWIESLDATQRERLLAMINVEGVGWPGSAGPVVHSFPVRRSGERRLAPGWLVHAVLRGGEGAGFELRMIDPWISLPAQLVVRSNDVRFGADSDSFLAAGLPALFVSDGSFVSFDPAYHGPDDRAERLDPARLERWSSAVASIVRRLDGLDGRPIDDDQYLVAFGRVWVRRDLLWLCFGTWAVLAVRGWLRGRRLAAAATRPAEFTFRVLFLVAAFVTPVFTAPLLVPAAWLSLWRPRSWVGRILVVVAALLPASSLVVLAAATRWRRFTGAWELGLPASLLLVAVLAAFAASYLRRPPSQSAA